MKNKGKQEKICMYSQRTEFRIAEHKKKKEKKLGQGEKEGLGSFLL